MRNSSICFLSRFELFWRSYTECLRIVLSRVRLRLKVGEFVGIELVTVNIGLGSGCGIIL